MHLSFYQSLKLACLLYVGGASHDDLVTTEVGTGPFEHAIGILTQKDFRLKKR